MTAPDINAPYRSECGDRLAEDVICDLPAEPGHEWHRDSETNSEWKSPEVGPTCPGGDRCRLPTHWPDPSRCSAAMPDSAAPQRSTDLHYPVSSGPVSQAWCACGERFIGYTRTDALRALLAHGDQRQSQVEDHPAADSPLHVTTVALHESRAEVVRLTERLAAVEAERDGLAQARDYWRHQWEARR